MKKILDALNEKAELSTDRGKYNGTRPRKITKKDRKHSGRYTPQIHQKGKFSEIIANVEEPREEYDEWTSMRDGFRYNSDENHFFSKWKSQRFDEEEVFKINKKIKKQIKIRKAKKIRKNKK